MTLIIGCITTEFGIIAGDTQATTDSHKAGGRATIELELKLHSPVKNTIYGIMGNWTNYLCNPSKPTLYNKINFHDLLKANFNNSKLPIIDSIGNFLYEKKNIEPTVLVIEKNDAISFRMWEVSNKNDFHLTTLQLDKATLSFNEPFSGINTNFIKNKLLAFYKENKLTNSLKDMCYLINNVLLELIVIGNNLSVSNLKGVTCFINKNTIGGVVTMSILHSKLNHPINLYDVYNIDNKTLLDQTTMMLTYSSYVNKEIRYIDNLAMIVKNSIKSQDKNFNKEIFEWINAQLLYISKNTELSVFQVNGLIEFVNKLYGVNLDRIDVKGESYELDFLIDYFMGARIENNSFYERFFI